MIMARQVNPDIKEYLNLRRCILKTLYESFKAFPYADIELREIESHCQTDIQTLNWNMVYLEKCGFVELGKSIEAPPYIACSAMISARGIDLVENEVEFNHRFADPLKKNQ